MGNDRLYFEEGSRLAAADSGVISPDEAAAAGAAAAAAVKKSGGRIFAAYGSGNGAAALAHAFASGALAGGADVIFGGCCVPSACAYAVQLLGCAMGCCTHTEISGELRFYAADGLPLYRCSEDMIEKRLSAQYPLPYNHYGTITYFDNADGLYGMKLRGLVKGSLKGIYADVYSSSEAVTRMCCDILSQVNDRSGERIAFRISSDGKRLSAFSEETGYVFSDRLVLLCMRERMEKGFDCGVCGRVTKSMEKLAQKYGRSIISCGRHICTSEDMPSEKCSAARELASSELYNHDAAALMMTVLDILSSKGISLKAALEGLPGGADVSRYIPVNSPSKLLERLCAVPDGVVSDGEGGRVTIRPVRTGKGIMLNVESYALEAASELCDFYSEIIKRESTRE